MKQIKSILLFIFMMFSMPAFSANNVVNVYAWTGEIPDFIVRQFENETHIKVNFSTFENNEIMFAKIRASKTAGYDVVTPSSYYIDRMSRQGYLEKLDKTKFSNWNNLNPDFLHPTYDKNNDYSTPFIWGVAGIFYNKKYIDGNSLKKWSDLWEKRFYNQLLLLDDTREIFSMALLSLDYSANDKNPAHIKEAFLKLKSLMPNVKVFSTDTVVSILIDEDANLGMAWNGDAFKAYRENPDIQFIYPEEGFVIWVDNFAVPKNAPHKEAAYAFINFIMRADVAKNIALTTSFPTANLAAQKLLPDYIRNNAKVYPPKEVMQRGQFQTDLGSDTLALYEKYWEELKMGG